MVKKTPANVGDARDGSSIPGLGRSLGGGNVYQLQYSCRESSMDRELGGLQSVGSQRVRGSWAHNKHDKIGNIIFPKVNAYFFLITKILHASQNLNISVIPTSRKWISPLLPMLVFRPFPSVTIPYVLGLGLLRCDQQVAAHHCFKGTRTRRRLERQVSASRELRKTALIFFKF